MPYIVTSKPGTNINSITKDLTSASYSPNPYIPSRAVPTTGSYFESSNRNETFELTKAEAAELRKDSRVDFVQKIPSGAFPDWVEATGSPVYEPTPKFRNYSGPNINYGDSRIVSDTVTLGFSNMGEDIFKSNNSYTNAAFIYQTNNHPLPSGSFPSGSTSYLDITMPADIWTGSRSSNGYNIISGSVGRSLDGEGVDLIIVDSVTNFYHCEFLKDPLKPFITGANYSAFYPDAEFKRGRGVEYKWFEELGMSDRTDPPSHYRRLGGSGDDGSYYRGTHGTRCLSLAAGNVFGWAPKARIYKMDCAFATQAGSTKYSAFECFQLIKRFHESKSIDPNTGHKRPTVVTTSISAQYRFYSGEDENNISHVNSIYPTGNLADTTGNNIQALPSYGFVRGLNGGKSRPQHHWWIPSAAADVDEAIEAGVIVVASAGNHGMPYASKFDTGSSLWRAEYGSPLYDSYYTRDVDTGFYDAGEPIYYHRPGWPGGNGVINVAEINWDFPAPLQSPYDQRRCGFGLMYRSTRGPRIDAAALAASAAASTVPLYQVPNSGTTGSDQATHVAYFVPKEDDREEGYSLNMNLTHTNYSGGGTSMAAPQIAGMACLWAQLYPTGTANEFKDFLKENVNPHSLENPVFPDFTTNLVTNNQTNPINTSSVFQGGNFLPLTGGLTPPSYSTMVPNTRFPIQCTAQYRPADDRIGLQNWPYNARNATSVNFSVDFNLKMG